MVVGGQGWGAGEPLIEAPAGSVVETADIRWIDGRLVMVVLGYGKGGMQVYVSGDSRTFVPAEPYLLESYLDILTPSVCNYLPGFIPDGKGGVGHMTAPVTIDEDGHYTMQVFRIEYEG